MQPLLSTPNIASAVVHNNDPRDEITEEDAIFDSTLVAPTEDCQRGTTITRVRMETSDEN